MTRRSALLAIGAALVFVPACSDARVVTSAYATRTEAEKEGAITGGWVPASLPTGAYELRAAHDPRTGQKWGLFNFHAEDADALRQMLQPGDAALGSVTCDIPARIEWWPRILRGTIDLEQATAAGLKAHRAKAGGLVMFVNWAQGRGYYWSE
jgi:hypothetical protein